MNKKGFTLVELLTVIVILAIIGAIGILAYTSLIKKSEDDYYRNLSDNLKLGATDYFINNRSARPGVNAICSKVNLEVLIEGRYIEDVVDAKGKECDLVNSFVYIKRNDKKQYEYETTIICGDYEKIVNEAEYCAN